MDEEEKAGEEIEGTSGIGKRNLLLETDESRHLRDLLKIPGLGVSKAEILYGAGYTNLSKLKTATSIDLLQMRGIGTKTVEIIRRYFSEIEKIELSVELPLKKLKKDAEDRLRKSDALLAVAQEAGTAMKEKLETMSEAFPARDEEKTERDIEIRRLWKIRRWVRLPCPSLL